MQFDDHSSMNTWLTRIAHSFRQVGVGIVLFVLAFPLLFWNEQGNVRATQSYDRDCLHVETVDVAHSAAARGKSLVYMTGQATSAQELLDEDFRIRSRAIKMRRIVEQFQWQEIVEDGTDKKQDKTKERSNVRYAKVWSEEPIASAKFKQAEQHNNPPMAFRSKFLVAKDVRLGSFKLNFKQVARIDRYAPLPLPDNAVDWMPEDRRAGWLVQENQLIFAAKHPSEPKIGDLRIRYEIVQPQFVSILAQPTQESFQAYQAANGRTIDELRLGVVPLAQMAEFPRRASTVGVWVLRITAFLAMTIGLALVFQPLVSLTNLGSLVQQFAARGANGLATTFAAAFSLSTIALAWVFYQPSFALALLAVALAVVAVYYVICRFSWQRQP